MTADERAILDLLLSEPFPGRDEAVRQADTCSVRPWDDGHCASLEFEVAGEVLIPGSRPLSTPFPVEGRAVDDDGLPIDIILFHRNGRLSVLEFVAYSDTMKRTPRPGDVHVRRAR